MLYGNGGSRNREDSREYFGTVIRAELGAELVDSLRSSEGFCLYDGFIGEFQDYPRYGYLWKFGYLSFGWIGML